MITTVFFKKMSRFVLTTGVIAVLLSARNAFAAGGTMDPTFGTNGIVTTQYNGLSSSANEVVLQADGKIVVLGSAKLSEYESGEVITRYNANGTLDTSFGVNGSVPIEVELFNASKIALQPDGKLIVGGTNWRGYFAVVRYNSNGTLDTSFGTNGLGVYDWSYNEFHQSLVDMTVQADGKIVLVGDYTAGQSNYADFSFARFNSDGTKDIGNNMIAFPNSRFNYGRAVVIQPDGKIVISGNMQDDDGKNQLSLARLNSDGSLDKSTFGNGSGTVATRLDFQNGSGALALQSDGKIIVAGNNFSSEDLTLARYNANGTLDTSFGGTGIVTTDFGANESLDDFVIQPDGKILVEGKTSSQDSSDFLLVRYNSDGSLDTTFGANGKVITDFGNSMDFAKGIALQSDGKAIVIGSNGEGGILARYDTGGSPVTTNTLTFKSVGSYDGWILESGENTNRGGTLEKVSNALFVGDDARDRQYRSILSFDTNSIPDNATITSAQVKIRGQGHVGTDPLTTHGNLLLEIRNGTFSNNVALIVDDFSAVANIGSTQDKFSGAGVDWYTADLSNANLALVNKYGVTQFRLLFSKDDNDDMGADYARFFSGNSASDPPQLIVTYSTSGGGTNNHAPVINGGPSISISIPENTTTLTAVTAVDVDGQTITYSISGPDVGKFSINPSTGLLAFVTAPDFEAIPSGTVYNLTAQASDGILTATQDIAVAVTPVNEFAPVITSNGGGAVANISLSENTMDVTTITATDADLPAQSLKYWITGGADGISGVFTINPPDGKITFTTPPSYNAPNDVGLDHVYNITVQASDGSLTDSQELIINILDPNPPPVSLLDSTFGTNGVAATKFNGLPSSTRDIVLQPDGKIVVLGDMQSTRIIARYNNNGALDTSFGSNGIVSNTFSSFSGKALALQPDGKLIVGGWNQGGFAAVRYNSNGSLDTAFGANGMGALETDSEHLYSAQDVTVQPDGKIVLVGDYQFRYGNHIDFQIARFNSDGTRDVINTIDWGDFPASRYNWGKAVVLQPDNKIVMSGDMIIEDVDKNDISLTRLTPNLRTDRSTFGTNGKGTVITRLDYFQNSPGALALQPDGKIVVAGTIFNTDMDVPQNLALARFNSDGTLDATFGGTGIVVTDFGAQESTANLVIQASGKIIVAGTTYSAGASDFLLVRYNGDGSLDTSFGTGGKLVTDLGNANDTATGIVQQPDGRVIVSGTSGENAILARYNTGASSGPATSFTFNSVGAHDGWILESGENSNKGGTLDKVSNVIYVGDDAKDRQYRSILSFDTNSVPDNATITSAQLKIKKQGLVGADPFNTHGNLLLEIRNGTFNNDIALTVDDFAAIANVGSTQDTFSASDADWYTTNLSNVNLGLVNKSGTTQFRLLFSKDDNDDLGADYVKFFSGNSVSDLPQLIVTYSAGGGGTTNQAPVIYGGASLSISIPENTTTVAGVTALDPDGQPITYSLSGTDAGKFSITPTGILSFVTAPDFETIPSGTVYHVTAQASDGSLTSTQDISVTVTPVNEFEPVVTSGAGTNISVSENTIDVTTLTATDADLPAASIEFLMGGADWQLFNFDAATGKLSFLTAPSYNTPNDAGLDHIYNLNFEINDGENVTHLDLVISILSPNSTPTGEMLDPTFGTNGVAATKFNGLTSSTRDIVLQPDGKLVVLGDMQSTKMIARYNTNGTLDTSFGTSGITSIDFPSFFVKKLALQPDGKLVVAGQQRGFAAVRYNSNGTLDTSFGTNGLAALESVNTSTDISYFVEDVTIQPDGKIVMAGSYSIGNHIEIEVVRFNSDGTRDVINSLDWGTFDSQYNYGKAVTIQPDNKIVMSGDMVSCCDTYQYISLARLEPNFSLDRSAFGSGRGAVTARLNYFQHSSGAIALQPDGRIIVAGTVLGTDWKTPQNIVMARFNTDGSLDTTFGGTGIVVTDFGAEESTANLVIQASGKIILAGTTSSAGASDFLLVGYNSDGSLDTSFGTNGKLTTDFGNSAESASGIVQQPDGKVIVSGTSGENAILARYNTGLSTSATSQTFTSIGTQDGWILESGENTNQGGSFDKVSNVLYVGDDAKNRQYRGFLSFDTNAIPDNVTITSAQLKIKKQTVTGTDPFGTHGNLLLDVRNGTFNNNAVLTVEDFSAIANSATQDNFSGAEANWYTASLSNANLSWVNKVGFTQFRLLFSKDDDDDLSADYVKFFSGNAASDQPQLIVTYSTVGSGTGNQPPVINGGAALSVNTPENTTLVSGVTATDFEGQPITYSISGLDAGRFTITPTGVLSFVTPPDFEAIPSGTVYHVTVQASDGSLTATQDIAVTVTPLNEFAPVMTSSGGTDISLPENTLDVTTITTTDADLSNPPINYLLGGLDWSLFHLDSSTGKLSFITPPSYSAPNDWELDHIYNININADDGRFSVWLEIAITIINPNSNATTSASTGFTALHQFGGQVGNGRVPYGVLVPYNGVFYGTTTYGGPPYDVPPANPDNKGNVFRMNMDGSDFTVLHEFMGGDNDGWKPWSGLAISGDMIYGSTVYGGPRGESGGVLYEMDLMGGGFRVLHAFGQPGDGFGGSTSPILVGDTLYGITRWGGNGTGTIYSYNTTTEVYTQLYRFAANSSDGNAPLGTLTEANDGYLYGLTWLGGTNNMGTLFRIKPDGSAFETLYHFAGGAQGKYPYDTLVFDGNRTLYGTTLGEYGVNLSDLGVIFKYDITSKAYSVLHKFAGGANDSGKPNGSVVLSSDGVTLYGSTHGDDAWGGTEFGILYQMYIDGTGFTQLHEFKGGADGATPMRTPLLIDGKLYGMAAYGGSENYGLIYRYQVADAGMQQRSFAALSINTSNPTFTSGNAFTVPENNVVVTTVTATDADIPAQPLTYCIIGGADAALFSLNPSTGELVYNATPDYEIPTDAGLDHTYNITLQVSDGVIPVTQDVAVTITSANDNNPVITSSNAISVSENTTAVTTVAATDADIPSQPLTYSIVGGADSTRFAIDSATGELTFIAAPDFDLPADIGADNAYKVTVQASDGELIGTQDIAVTVIPVNDNTPAITSTAGLPVSENSTIVTTVTAMDGDLPAQPLTYSIAGGADSTLFAVNPSTGELTFTAAPDFEAQKDAGMDNIYNVTVQASDGTFVTTQDVAVTVTPVNDNMPVITSPAGFSISENTAVVTTVTATDADLPAEILTYSIIGGADSASFTINPSTGVLDFLTARDYETPNDAGSDNIYNLTIQASDGAFTVTQDVVVTILPVNDNSPVIASPTTFSIPENTITIATLAATDVDRPAEALTYSIVGGADAVKFSIASDTGELKFVTAPDFEVPADFNLDNVYEVVVQVSDGTYNSTQNIAVQVSNITNQFPFETAP